MTVSKPIIVAPTKTRNNTRMVVGTITGTEPPAARQYILDGQVTFVDQSPDREGQIIFYRPPNSGGIVIMYVVVNRDGQGALSWAPVVPNIPPIDPRTGKTKDPLYDFYGIHAS